MSGSVPSAFRYVKYNWSIFLNVTKMAAKPRLPVPFFCCWLGNGVVDEVKYGAITARLGPITTNILRRYLLIEF